MLKKFRRKRLRENDDVLGKINSTIPKLDRVLGNINRYCDATIDEAKRALKDPDGYDINQINIDLKRIIRVLDEANDDMRDY